MSGALVTLDWRGGCLHDDMGTRLVLFLNDFNDESFWPLHGITKRLTSFLQVVRVGNVCCKCNWLTVCVAKTSRCMRSFLCTCFLTANASRLSVTSPLIDLAHLLTPQLMMTRCFALEAVPSSQLVDNDDDELPLMHSIRVGFWWWQGVLSTGQTLRVGFERWHIWSADHGPKGMSEGSELIHTYKLGREAVPGRKHSCTVLRSDSAN